MWTKALQAHFLKPHGTNRLSVQHLVPQDCTDGKLRCPWDNSRPSSEILPSHTQDNYSHLPNRQITVRAELHLQKNPLTVCAARYCTNYGGNGGMYAKTPEKTLKNSQTSTNESVKKNLNVKEACRTVKMCNAKGVAPKLSMIWHFSSYVHECSCRSSTLWFVRPDLFMKLHEGPTLKRKQKYELRKVQRFTKASQ